MPKNTHFPDRARALNLLIDKRRKGYELESGSVTSADIQAVIDAFDADTTWKGSHDRGDMSKRESRAYLVALKAEKVAAGL